MRSMLEAFGKTLSGLSGAALAPAWVLEGGRMAAKSLQELFVEELRDMYDAEKRLTKALPKLARAATSAELQRAFTNHARETERQVGRLEQVFRSIGEPVRGKKCDGIMGIIEESNTAMEELDGAVLDAALIAGAQKAEHYEIASYGTLAQFAETLGHMKAKELLGTTLDEEKAADEKLNTIATSEVNHEAMGEESEEADETGFSLAGSARRAASAMGMAQERTPPRSRGASSSRGRASTGRKSAKKR
jgi:ferritin-like metal-binding protein YciE